MPAFDSLYREKAHLWAAIYANRQTQLGATATLINFGDQENAGKVNATTFTGAKFSATGLSPVWTPSEALSAFDTPFLLVNPDNYQGLAPILTMNGTDEEADTPDAAFWSRAAGAFSVGAWVNLTDATSSAILAKYTVAGDLREWVFWLNAADKLQLILYDENDAVTPNASLDSVADTALTQGIWVFVVATYDGTANASGINLYQNGVLVASTDTDDVNFDSLRDTTALVEFGKANATSFFDGKMAGGALGPFFVQAALTVEQIYNMYSLERLGMGV